MRNTVNVGKAVISDSQGCSHASTLPSESVTETGGCPYQAETSYPICYYLFYPYFKNSNNSRRVLTLRIVLVVGVSSVFLLFELLNQVLDGR